MILRVVLAILLAFLPAVCRCHIGLHHHDDHVHVATAHGWMHVPVVHDRAEHTHNDHHHHSHGSAHDHDHHHDEHGHDDEASEHHHDLFSMILCEHGNYDCACPPLMTSLQKTDDLPRAMLVAFVPLDILVRPIDLPAHLTQARIKEQDHVPRPPSALVRLHCALIV